MLLAAPIYFEKMMGIEGISYGVCFHVAELATGQETALALTADSMLYKLDMQDAQESNC